MSKLLKSVLLIILCAWSCRLSAQENGLDALEFLVGKWQAYASDSSFSSELVYEYSPNKKLLMATNFLYNRAGERFAIYEGAYLFEVDHLAYFIAGPGGETHRGTAEVDRKRVVHKARMFPGNNVKSYLSEMQFKDNQLLYFASYSDQETFPTSVDYKNPLVYKKVEE